MTSLTRLLSSTRKHDVFLSFRGEDTRTAFTDHLYNALTRQGINTYRDDDNLRVGDLISPKLLEAIAASRFGIVVLSGGYATSPWCLDELAYIVDCKEKMELIVIPVFYYVNPSDVRHQRNTFEQAFAQHETSNRFAPEKVKTWRAALKKVGDIDGLHIKGTRYESEEISKIVGRIFKDLQDTLPRDATRGLIGIESRVEELKSLLNLESDDVRFIGICGMSGMGKTTLAEVVYEGIRDQFQGCSFIGNIKDISRKNDSDLCKLQQKLLVDILKDERIRVRSVVEGVSMLQERLCGLKIIIVLDDVNLPDQLNFLSRKREWFGSGSRIIITTTNEDLLRVHRVDRRYKCEGLALSDATRLFNLSAFAEGQPKHDYERLSSDIVELAGGLPLALNAFGSLLFGKGEEYWRETLEKLQQFPDEKILQRLEICYDRLDRNEKEIFIYIACFLKGRDEVLVKDILKNIGKCPVRGIDILKNRSLITINYDDSVWMHDLLQQMGWEVLRKKRPGKRVGLKCRRDIVDICTSIEKGTNAIEIINQEQYGAEVKNCTGDPKSFSNMKKLKFLRISNVYFSDGLKHLSNDLRILEWYGCSLKSFPQTFEPKQIYELDMRSSRLEKLWEKDIDLPNLRSINLCGSEDLTKIPDLTSTPNLLTLNLEGCTNLVELHKSLLNHKTLYYVNLKGCRNLQNLGNNMEMDALEALHLSGCSKLERIPEFGENMKILEHLYLDGTKIKQLPESLGKIRSLRKLDVSETAIEELPSFLLQLERLRLLHIHGCHLLSLTKTFHSMELSSLGLKELVLSACNLSAIPDGIGLLSSLRELDLSKNDFVTLPASISCLSNLRMLCLNSCTKLESLPKLSKINEDTFYYGVEIRFCHYISGEELDVSKFRSSSHDINPTVSCLNCPKLIENERGSGLADTILKKYFQVRTERIVIPEAIFEIVAAGSEIPPWFNLVESHSVILEGIETKHHGIWDVFDVNFDTCIGVALCAVIVIPHSLVRGVYIEVKYEVVAHIHVAGKYWRIPVPINFLEAELETQLVWYWPVTDDLQGAVDPSQKNQFEISFSVEPEDCNLEVKKYGVRFLCREDILDLRGSRISINGIPSIMKQISFFCDFNDPDTKVATRKRKATPRWTEQVQVCPGTGLEGPLDDGYSWRYGQKDILGAKYPRVCSSFDLLLEGNVMQQSSGQSSTGPSMVTSINVSKELRRGALGFLSGSDAYHASSDATLFSSSLPVIPHEKLKLNHTEDGYQSVDDLSSTLNKLHTDGEANDLLGDVEDHAIGSFLPDDEDELLAGVMDGFDLSGLPNRMDDLDEYDLFGSGGGLELESDVGISKVSLSDGVFGNGVAQYSLPNGAGAVAGEHPYGEHPSRTLFVRNINSNVEDPELRTLFEQYGDIRTLYTACKHRGFVMISYYDIRAARTAMRALQNKPLRRRKLDIHFSIPKDNPSDKDINQGTLVVFNLDPSVSNDDLLQIFGVYGEVKEIRETPHKRHHKFVEYYDVRASEAALRSLNRSDIAGKRIKLEPSRPGGARRNLMLQLNQDLEQDDTRSFRLQVGSSIANSPPGNWPQYGSPVEHSSLQTLSKSPVLGSMSPAIGNNSPGLASILHPQLSNSGKLAPIGKDYGRGNHVEPAFINGNLNHGVAFQHSHSLPEPKLSQFSGTTSTFGASTSNGSGIETLSGPQFLWGSPNLQAEHTNSSAWRTPSIRQPFTSNGQYHGFPYTGHHGSIISSSQPAHHHHHVGSAPSGIPFERHFSHYQESSDTLFRSPTFGGIGLGHNDRSFMGPHGSANTVFPEIGSSSFSMMPSPRPNSMFLGGNSHYPGLAPISMDSFTERGRSRRVEHSASQIDNKMQFQLDLDKILNGEDARTTLMIKNIPNKYTSKMLLAAIDENHRGTYDFLYLPIDFKNKCNVGYAFINMLSPSHIIPFYQAFNGKKWEKFNSEKVASLAYARIQGKMALVTHFQNSSLMNEDKRCRPILFHSDGSEAGDQVIQEPLPSNSLNIQISGSNGLGPDSGAGESSRSTTKDGASDGSSTLGKS